LVPAPIVRPGTAPAGRGRLWQGLLGIVISVGFLVWALWGVKFADVVRDLRQADPLWFVLSALTATLTFPLRTIRWRILLHSSKGDTPFVPVWRATAIGFMANNVLPARAGEVVRAYAADRLVGVPFSTALASVAVERVFDGVVIVLLLAIGVAAPGFPSGAVVGREAAALTTTMAATFIGVLVVLIVLTRSKDRALPTAERLIRRVIPARLAERAIVLLHNLVAGFGVLHSGRDIFRVILWTSVQWLVNAASYVFAFFAFHLAVPISAALVMQGVVAFGVALPQAPGFFGVFEGLSKLVLVPYGIGESEAVSFAIGTHMGWFAPITIIGLVILARTGLSLKDLRSGDAPGSPPRQP
jgi:hypothetical protein